MKQRGITLKAVFFSIIPLFNLDLVLLRLVIYKIFWKLIKDTVHILFTIANGGWSKSAISQWSVFPELCPFFTLKVMDFFFKKHISWLFTKVFVLVQRRDINKSHNTLELLNSIFFIAIAFDKRALALHALLLIYTSRRWSCGHDFT